MKMILELNMMKKQIKKKTTNEVKRMAGQKRNRYIFIAVAIMTVTLIITAVKLDDFSDARHYLNGMHQVAGNEGMCDEMNRTFKNDRCYLTVLDVFDENDSSIDIDCSWGNYTVEIDTDYAITTKDMAKNFDFILFQRPMLKLMGCRFN